jgi:O-antigen/teichoic acid export membrane protein
VLVQTALIPQWIPDYSAVSAEWTLAVLFAGAYDILGLGLYNGLMPSLAEAYLHKYQTLLRFYISQGLHYGMWFSLFLLAVLSAVGERVVQGIFGLAYAGAVPWIVPVLGWGAIQWPVWTANQVLIAMKRPAVTSWLTIGEQGLRLGLMVVLAPALGLRGLLVAFTVAGVVRAVVAWLVIQRSIGRPRVYVWRTLIAPAGAAWVIQNLLRIVGERWWTPTFSASLTLALVALLPTLALYGFLTALFGGWDDGSLDELWRAMRISGVGLPLAWLLTMAVRLGAFSPLHGRFPMGLRSLAEDEARALTVGRAPIE